MKAFKESNKDGFMDESNYKTKHQREERISFSSPAMKGTNLHPWKFVIMHTHGVLNAVWNQK